MAIAVPWSRDALIYSDREFVVETSLKGNLPTPLRVRLAGGTVSDVTMIFEDQARITPGQRYIMFLSELRTPTQEGHELAWVIAGYEGVFEADAGGRWRNHVAATETTVDGVQRLLR